MEVYAGTWDELYLGLLWNKSIMYRDMILIQSSSGDVSTDCVLDWLFHLDSDPKILRLNDVCRPTSLICHLSNEVEHFSFQTDTITTDVSDCHGYWYRRGTLDFRSLFNNSVYSKLGESGIRYLSRESDMIRDLFDRILGKATLNIESDNYTNKLANL